jgi:hypothetical protein
MKKAIIIGDRKSLDDERLFDFFGFETGKEYIIKNPECENPLFYEILSPLFNKFFTINPKLIKLI